MENPITYFAETDSRNKRVKFGIKDEDRLRHIYSIGKTGMGKSTMLENMAIQDIQNGNGMAFLDPHGKTADLLLDYIPEHRMKDLIYFAPFDTEFPISFNVMEDVQPDRRHLVVSGLMSAFEKIWEDQWSSRMAYILQNTLAALLEYPGATMLGINRMLTDKVYRNKVVANVKDPTTKAFWVDEFANYTERFAAEATPAIQNKVGQFVSNPLIRNIIGQPKSSFDVRKIMDEKKILIVNLSKGLVGEGNANLLGAMLVTKIYLAAMSRADVDPQELKKLPNFYLYVDEFQSFANKSFADILSEARKYKLSLNITHQYIEQMAEEVRAAVFGNVGTMVAFRVGSFDADVLEKEFAPTFTAEDIVNLGQYQIYLKLMIDGVASQPFSAVTSPPIPRPEISFREQSLEMSRKNFTTPKEEVEKIIREWHAPEQKIESRSIVGEARKEQRPEKRGERSEQYKPQEPKIEQVKPAEKRAEQRFEQPKPKENMEQSTVPPRSQINAVPSKSLAKAIEEAMKQKKFEAESLKFKEEKKEEVKKVEIKVEQKKETMSLEDLRRAEKGNSKMPSPQNISALKEAIEKAKKLESKVESKNKEEINKNEKSATFAKSFGETKVSSVKDSGGPNASFAKGSGGPKEVPEETLRKILKGE